MQLLAVHPDVVVAVSQIWQTTSTAVRSADEGFVIDSPVLPDELQALPGVLEQASFPVSGLLVTHADWDHLLGRLAFPGASLGAGATTLERIEQEPGAAQRELRAFDEAHYIERPKPLSLAGAQSLPVPGRLSVGERELELHPTPGHTVDGTAYFIPWANVLVAGDYLSPVESPMCVDADAYVETLERLRALVLRADTVIPGHGRPLTQKRALELLEEGLSYLQRR